MVHGFLLDGDRSVEAIAVTARIIMKQTTDFLGKFVSPKFGYLRNLYGFYYQMHYKGEPEVISIAQDSEQSLKDFDMKMTTCRTEAKLYMCINGQWV